MTRSLLLVTALALPGCASLDTQVDRIGAAADAGLEASLAASYVAACRAPTIGSVLRRFPRGEALEGYLTWCEVTREMSR